MLTWGQQIWFTINIGTIILVTIILITDFANFSLQVQF